MLAAMMFMMFGIVVAIKGMELFRAHEDGGKAVESATDKAADYIDKLFK